MANNVSALDSAGTAKIVKTTETASVHVPHVNIENVSEITTGQDDLLAAIGEVQASPTENTVLDRLKAINTALVTTLGGFLNDVEGLLTSIRDNADGLEAAIATLNGTDFATETTTASILAKIIAAPATEAKQDDAITELSGILAKITADPSTGAKQDAVAALVGEVDANPTANTVLDRLKAINTSLSTTLSGYVDGIEALLTTIRDNADGLEAAFVTLNANDFATEAKQDDAISELVSLVAKDYATQTTLAAVEAKLIAAPATEAKQDTLIAKDFATQATLADLLAKVIAAPATEAKQDTIIGHVDGVESALTTLNGAVATAANQIGTAYTDRGATITIGGTAQQLAAANAVRRYLVVQNDSDEDMRVHPSGTASSTAGALLPPSAVWEPIPPPVGAISIFAATTGKRFQAWEG